MKFNGLVVHLHIFMKYFAISIKSCNISDVGLGYRPKIKFISFRSNFTSIASNLLTKSCKKVMC